MKEKHKRKHDDRHFVCRVPPNMISAGKKLFYDDDTMGDK